jgi:hypothetical protein
MVRRSDLSHSLIYKDEALYSWESAIPNCLKHTIWCKYIFVIKQNL